MRDPELLIINKYVDKPKKLKKIYKYIYIALWKYYANLIFKWLSLTFSTLSLREWPFPSLNVDLFIIAIRDISQISKHNGKQCRSWWDGSWWAVSSGSALFAQLSGLVCRVGKVKCHMEISDIIKLISNRNKPPNNNKMTLTQIFPDRVSTKMFQSLPPATFTVQKIYVHQIYTNGIGRY